MNGVDSIIRMLQQYFAGNALPVIACIALLYWGRKSINRKRYLVCVAILFALFLNDFTFRCIVKIGENATFYRILWIFPIPLLAAYLVVELWSSLSGWKRGLLIALTAVFVLVNASPNWSTWGHLPSNIYQMDDEVLAIADMIDAHSGGVRVNVIDDYSVTLYIREYDDLLCDPGAEDYYLRQIISENYVGYTKDQIENAAVLALTDYIILQKTKIEANAAFERAEFELIGSTENYNIYYTNRPALEAGRS
jgi:hypothetical protein